MKKFNTFIALFLGLVLICSLFGCGGDSAKGKKGKNRPDVQNRKGAPQQKKNDAPTNDAPANDAPTNGSNESSNSNTDAADSLNDVDGDGFLQSPFDATVAKLPAGFMGNNIEVVWEGSSAVDDLKKDEFETTEEFTRRKQEAIKEGRVTDKIKLNDYVAFCLNVGDNDQASFSYDADKQTFSCSHKSILKDSGSYGTISVFSRIINPETYIGKNAFGVEKEIKKGIYKGYGVAFSRPVNTNTKPGYNYSVPHWIASDVPVAFAKENKENMAICCVGKIGRVDGENFIESEIIEPTIDKPYDFVNFKECVYLKDVEFWLFNKNSGDVYAKFTLADYWTSTPRKLGDVALNSQNADVLNADASNENNLHDASGASDAESNPELQKNDVEELANEPFDVNVEKLPLNFNGVDVSKIEEALVELETSLEKGEFETTEEYRGRSQKTIDDAFASRKLKNLDYVCVCLPHNSYSGTKISYDADERETKIELDKGYSKFFENKKYLYVDIGPWGLSGERRRYLGFKTDTEYRKYSTSESGAERSGLVLRILNVPVDFARDNKDFLNVCVVGKLNVTPPEYHTVSVSSSSEVKLEKCVDKENVNIPLKDVEFWVYNVKTGEIYDKFSLDDYGCGKGRELGDVSLKAGAQNVLDSKSEQPTQSPENDAEEVEEPKPAWEEVVANVPELPSQSWETKKASVVVKSDSKDLAKTLAESKNGAIVHLESGAKITLDASSLPKGTEAVFLDKAIAVVGEGEGASILIDPRDTTIEIASKNVFFKNVTFQCVDEGGKESSASIFKVKDSGKAFFIDCAFDGAGLAGVGGVLVEKGEAKFWKCAFKNFGEYGLNAADDGSTEIDYCELLGNAAGAKVENKAKCVVKYCRFAENRCGYAATSGGGGSIENSYFDQNGQNWQISSGSKDVVELNRKTNVIEK